MIFSKNGATVSLPLESQGARVGALGSGCIDRLPELPVEGLRVASWHSDGSIQLPRVGDSRKVGMCVSKGCPQCCKCSLGTWHRWGSRLKLSFQIMSISLTSWPGVCVGKQAMLYFTCLLCIPGSLSPYLSRARITALSRASLPSVAQPRPPDTPQTMLSFMQKAQRARFFWPLGESSEMLKEWP